MELTFMYDAGWGAGWIAARPAHMRRASHALAHEGAVWLVDPVDGPGLEERIAPLGEVAGVVQLLDRHGRDCVALAERHGVPLVMMPEGTIPGTPFRGVAVVRRRLWRESALWWPERRALVVGDALGTAPYFPAPGERVGVHPLLRMVPPDTLGALEPLRLLPGHGPPVCGDEVPELVRRAVARSRREIPAWLAGLPRALRGGARSRR